MGFQLSGDRRPHAAHAVRPVNDRVEVYRRKIAAKPGMARNGFKRTQLLHAKTGGLVPQSMKLNR